MLIVPNVLIATMYVAFQHLTAYLGFPLGYLLAFVLFAPAELKFAICVSPTDDDEICALGQS
jgi:hypothetical protein